MFRSHSQPPPIRRAGKTIVFNDAEWSRICFHLHRGEPEAQQAEQQRAYAAYLRDGSAAMTRHWTNSRRAQREQQQEAKRARDEAIVLEGQQRCDAMVAGDEERRKERIAAAQRLIDRVQAGPRQLESAYLLADVLQTRQQQREQNARERCESKARAAEMAREQRTASEQGLAEHRERIMVRRRAEDGYKRELAAFVCQEREDRCREKERLAAEAKRHRDEGELAMAAELKNDMEMARRKKAAERQRVFEEIRGKREQENKTQTVDNIDDKIVDVLAQANDLNEERNRRHRADLAERDRRHVDAITRMHAKTSELTMRAQREEEQRIATAMAEKEAEARARDADRLRAVQQRRTERQQAHAQAEQVAEQRRQETQQLHRESIECRMRNAEVSNAAEVKHWTQLRDKRMQFSGTLLEQIADTKQRRAEQKQADVRAAIEPAAKAAASEDAKFFEMAERLMGEAAAKQRNLLPLRRCVEQYRRDNAVKGGSSSSGFGRDKR